MTVAQAWRGVLGRALLLIFAATQASTLSFRSLPVVVGRLPGLLSRRAAAELDPAAFWFDPGYGAFLTAVRRRIPEDATVALVVPRTIDLYVYCAAYELAPRRVVEEDALEGARFVAVYKREVPAGLSLHEEVTGGILLRR